jgi:hypothetical protein
MNIQPADRMIAAVLEDLAKWESQEPSFNAPAKKRTLRLVSLAQDRLVQSTHQDDPSWKVAQDRLTALQRRLEGKEKEEVTKPTTNNDTTGKKAQVQEASVTTTKPISTKAVTTTTVSSNSSSGSGGTIMGVSSTTASTNNTPTTAADAGGGGGNQPMPSYERTRLIKLRRDCESAKDRLDPKRFSDPAYLRQAADAEARLQEQLLRYVTHYSMDPDVEAAAQALQQYSEAIRQASVIGAHNAHRMTIEKLVSEIVRTYQEIIHWGPTPFQDTNYREKQLGLLRDYQQRKEQVSSEDNNSTPTLDEKMKDLEQLITSYQDEAFSILSELGDWRESVQEAESVLESSTSTTSNTAKLEEPDLPYEASAIKTFFEQGALYENNALKLQKTLSTITAKAYIAQVQEGNHVKSVLFKLQDSLRTLQRAMQSVAANLESQMSQMDSQLDWFDDKDPYKPLDQVNIFLGANGDQQVILLDTMLINVQAAVAYALTTNKDDLLTKYQAVQSRIESTKNKFVSDRAVAWDQLRMPKAVTPTVCSYEELEDIARTTLGNPKYEGIGEIVRLVVNTDKRCGLSRTEKDVKIKDVDTYGQDVIFSGTETITTWTWDEFQCCTAEASEDDKYYLYYNTFKFFTSGSSVTPIGKWVLSGRHVSTEIAFDNIAKD